MFVGVEQFFDQIFTVRGIVIRVPKYRHGVPDGFDAGGTGFILPLLFQNGFGRSRLNDRKSFGFPMFSAIFDNNQTNRCCENRMITEWCSLSLITKRLLKGEWTLTNVTTKTSRRVVQPSLVLFNVRGIVSDNIIFERYELDGVFVLVKFVTV